MKFVLLAMPVTGGSSRRGTRDFLVGEPTKWRYLDNLSLDKSVITFSFPYKTKILACCA